MGSTYLCALALVALTLFIGMAILSVVAFYVYRIGLLHGATQVRSLDTLMAKSGPGPSLEEEDRRMLARRKHGIFNPGALLGAISQRDQRKVKAEEDGGGEGGLDK